MGIIESIISKAKENKKTIVMPESFDDRVLFAAEKLTKQNIANVITIGDEDTIRKKANELGVNLSGVRIITPSKHSNFSDFANSFYNKRKHKGITIEQAREMINNNLFFAAMLVDADQADAFIAGSTASTADVLRVALQCVGVREGVSTLSSFFLMVFPNRVLSFADCAVVPNPDANQLADIAISTAENHKKLTGEDANVAMLSFSTKGSGKHELVDKVIEATQIAKQKRPDLNIDGELQFDAAIVNAIAKKKAPNSNVAGRANVLVFPDLQSGNIGYKIAQRLAGAEAIGPVSQGLKKPIFDLSRGCSVDDIVSTSAIACLMA
ncbi:MAG: phosphate acetyltransferase [Melioribacteraceae bacterium]